MFSRIPRDTLCQLEVDFQVEVLTQHGGLWGFAETTAERDRLLRDELRLRVQTMLRAAMCGSGRRSIVPGRSPRRGQGQGSFATSSPRGRDLEW